MQRRRSEERVGDAGVVGNVAEKALAIHFSVSRSGDVEGGHDALNGTVAFVNLGFLAEFMVVGIPIAVGFLDGQKVF